MVRTFFKKIICASVIILFLFPLFALFIRDSYTDDPHYVSPEAIKLSNTDLDIDLSLLPEIDYTILNEIWFESKIEMLIITPNNTEFINAVNPLKNWKNEKGVKTIVLSNFSLYEGIDNAEKIRNMIKSYYTEENIRWVLLAGDAQDDLIPIREVYNPDTVRWTNTNPEIGSEDYKPTDFYYADLTGSWDNDNDENWGEAPQDNTFNLDEISWTPEVYVGRLPASNAIELESMINKTLQYEINPYIGDWMNKMLLAGGISNYADPPDDPDGEDESRLTEYIWKNYVIPEMEFTHLYRNYTFAPETPPFPNEEGPLGSFKNKFNDGYSTVIFAGHGAYNQLADQRGGVYYNSDATSASNANMPSLIYADACTTAPYDIKDNNLGEILIKKDNSGAIGFIGGLRVTWYFSEDPNLEKINRGNAKLFWEEFFQNKKFQQGRALYDSKVSYINSDYFTTGTGSLNNDFERKNILTYCLLGDPELDIYTNEPILARNPITEQPYEGQLVSVTVKDINGSIVPYGSVHLRTADGKYQTVYADIDGNVKFRLPVEENEYYNVTITGHNLIPSYFNLETNADYEKPQLLEVSTTPKNPSISNNIYLNVQASDNYSGIESVFLFISNDNFQKFSFYQLSNDLLENENSFAFDLGRLKPNEYAYSIIVRDYANNTQIFNNDGFRFIIAKPIMDYVLPTSLVLIIGVAGISVFITYKGIQKYSEIARKID